MAKKQWTEEERKAFGLKMKAARQNKNLPKPNEEELQSPVVDDPATPEVEPTPGTTVVSMDDYNALLKQIEEMKNIQWKLMGQNMSPAEVGMQNGKLLGTVEKYKVDGKYYPDPSARLAEEVKLARFAFPLNYELDWSVTTVAYTTIDNIRTKEPRFQLQLSRIVMDEETGEPTNGRYVICRLMMHEDPDTALTIAREQGLEIDQSDEQAFMNEMRYIRVRDWLIEAFYPAPIKHDNGAREMVINGKLVTYYEKSNDKGERTEKIDWDKMPKIKF